MGPTFFKCFLLLMPPVAEPWLGSSVAFSDCVFEYVHILKEKWFELSRQNLVDVQLTAVVGHAFTLKSKGQRSRSVVGMHVDKTAA